jgi:glycerol-3-phosphate acyltransferase PlsY
MTAAILIILASYLIGAFPVAYVTGRLLRGVDLREYGSANIGASNVWQSVARWAVVPVGLTEIAQGMAGILIAKLADQSLTVQTLAGLAAIAGHNWSVYLRFSGGRGIGHSIGFMLVLSWPALGVFIAVSLLGVALGVIPTAVGLGIALAPLAALVKGQSTAIVLGCLGMFVIIIVKRLLTNHPLPAPGTEWREVFLNRLLLDRDTREREEWVRRQPQDLGRAR